MQWLQQDRTFPGAVRPNPLAMCRKLALCLGLFVLLLASPAWANMANPWQPGEPVGEPVGTLKDLSILHETLNIDLTPLDSNRPATVMVRYVVENKKQPVNLDLLFITLGIKNGVVSLNNKRVNSQLVKDQPVPSLWRLPKSAENRGLRMPKKLQGIKFQVTLPQGKHQLVVQYQATTGQFHPRNRMYRDYILGYLFAPARRWGSFGKLDIFVKVQKRWKLSSSLPLTKRGNVWSGGFNKIPADAMVLRVHQKSSPWVPFGFAYSLLGLLLGLGFTTYLLRYHAKHTRKQGFARAWPFLGHALLAALISAGLVWGGMALEKIMLDSTQISHSWSYKQAIIHMLLFFGSMPAAMLIGVAVYLVSIPTDAFDEADIA